MQDAKPVVTLMNSQILEADIEGAKMDSSLYKREIWSLLYLAVGTRPAISSAVGRLAQNVEKPTETLLVVVKRALRYIAGTKKVGVLYKASESLTPVGYTDSDWGGCTEVRKSTSGYVFLIAGDTISWKSQKQCWVAQSSSEVEYMALSASVKEAI